MRACTVCGSDRVADDWRCDDCGSQPGMIAGFRAFAPDLAADSPGFRAQYFGELADLETGNFWFRARNDLIAWSMHKYVPECTSFLEIGCGTGFVLSRIASEYPSTALTGGEIFTTGLEFARHRVPSAELYQMDARAIPFRGAFDAIGAFDMLEHVEEDEKVIAEVATALRPGGVLIATVPQHPSLWSQQDVNAHHVRRYSRTELRRKVEAGGFEILRLQSFVSLLLPMMFASRQRMAKVSTATEGSGTEALEFPGPLNAALGAVMTVERAMITFGVSFPAGGSLMLIARLRSQHETAA